MPYRYDYLVGPFLSELRIAALGTVATTRTRFLLTSRAWPLWRFFFFAPESIHKISIGLVRHTILYHCIPQCDDHDDYIPQCVDHDDCCKKVEDCCNTIEECCNTIEECWNITGDYCNKTEDFCNTTDLTLAWRTSWKMVQFKMRSNPKKTS